MDERMTNYPAESRMVKHKGLTRDTSEFAPYNLRKTQQLKAKAE